MQEFSKLECGGAVRNVQVFFFLNHLPPCLFVHQHTLTHTPHDLLQELSCFTICRTTMNGRTLPQLTGLQIKRQIADPLVGLSRGPHLIQLIQPQKNLSHQHPTTEQCSVHSSPLQTVARELAFHPSTHPARVLALKQYQPAAT